jgi:hypothetical protein
VHQKDVALRAWRAAGLDRSDDPQVVAFLKRVKAASGACWAELVAECRDRLPSQMRALVTPLWKSGDKLLRVNLIRAADPARRDELALLLDAAQSCDARGDEPELRALVEKRHKRLLDAVASKPGLSRQFELFVRAHPQSGEA